MKRTKRYGGFRIGDRVEHKKYGKGVVEGYFNGCIFVWFDKFVMNGDYFGSAIAPNQLINLTRLEEENRKITDPLPPFPKGLAEELNKRCEEYLKIINQDDFMKDLEHKDHDIMPPNIPYPISPGNMFKSYKDIEDKIKKIGDEIYSCELELDRIKVRDCVQYTKLDINRIVACDPLPSPYTSDVYTTTKDF